MVGLDFSNVRGLALTRNDAMFVWRVIGVFCVWLIVACQSRSVAGCGCECLA